LSLHVPTLLLALLTGFLMLCVQLAVAQHGRLRQPALRVWAQASWSLLFGYAFLGARFLLPAWISIWVGNALILLGLLLYTQALSIYLLDRRLSAWSWLPLGLVTALIPFMLSWSFAARTAVMSFAVVALIVPSIVLVVRHHRKGETSLRLVGLTMAMTALVVLVRGVHSLLEPQAYQDLMEDSLLQGLTFLVSFVSLLGTGFGFVLASFERMAKQMEEMASLDGMTGCLNRSTTDALLAHSLERGRRDGAPVAFALFDLDHFKLINDRHGHRAGDDALRAVVRVVKARLRGADVLGRMGGEEFGLILPGTDAPGAQRLVDDMRRSIEQLALRDDQGRALALTVSAGVAVAASNQKLGAERLFALADQALYRAKDAGRNCVMVWSEMPLPPARPEVDRA